MPKTTLHKLLAVGGLVLALGLLFLFMPTEKNEKSNEVAGLLPKGTISNEAFKDLFPLQYESYNRTGNEIKTPNNGSVKETKFSKEKEPLLPILFNGYGFAKDYNEDRGHAYGLKDVSTTLRLSDSTPGACLTCKSSAVPQLIDEMGTSFYSKNFKNEILPKAESMGHSSIGCSDCHDPQTMKLQVTRPHFIEAMEFRGVDVVNADRSEMKNYVCAQCHVEYYFRGEEKKVTLPLQIAYTAEGGSGYYMKERWMFEGDFINGVSGTSIVKSNHPDFETFMEGPHRKNGASCVDCHMPKETTADGKEYRSHYMTSPINNIEGTCMNCHKKQTKNELIKGITDIQKTTTERLHKAQLISTRAHYYVNSLITNNANAADIKTAQELIRRGQWYWDFVASENGTGFHNPEGALEDLDKSIEASQMALNLAGQILKEKGVNLTTLERNIQIRINRVSNEKDPVKKQQLATDKMFPSQIK